MASIFPAISPNTRVYSTGGFVTVERSGADGSYNAFRRGSRQVGQTLKLQFRYLTETNMNLIKSHYLDRKGSFDFFLASGELWGDYSDEPPVPLLGNTVWRFARPPVVTDVSFDRFDVSVDLVSHAVLQGDLQSVGATSGAVDPDYTYNGASATAVPAYILDPGAS
jgi:hypothetical protein|tara:strand:+ start:58 stop:555 length:498 start_codon:yes stop_codon:yes gene_type:complete